MAEKNTMLAVKNLNVHYGDFQALWDISIEVQKGEIACIIGANGSGKSTLMRTICGLSQPTSGNITFKGEKIFGLKPYQIVSRGITMVPEGRRIFPRLSVMENLALGAYMPETRKKKESLLKSIFTLFPLLDERRKQLASTLSGGEQQMLAIARALMSEPTFILIDEVSLGLAPIIVKDVYRKVQEINQQGISVLLVDQNVKRSMEIARKTYVLCQGKVVLAGKSDQLTEDEVKKAYFGLIKKSG